jgi:hypothetical protein
MSIPLHPIASLKQGLRAQLLADGDIAARIGTAIFDTPPRGAKPPYLILGDAIGRDDGALEAEAMVVEFDLHAITSERGTALALDLVACIETMLRGPMPLLPDHHPVSLDVRHMAVRHDAATSITRATLRLRAFVEPL